MNINSKTINRTEGAPSVLIANLGILSKSMTVIRHYLDYKHANTDLYKILDHHETLLKGIMMNKGVPYCIGLMKEVRIEAFRHLSGNPLPNNYPRKYWFRRQHSTGLPVLLGDQFIKHWLLKDPVSLRILVTLLYLGRWFKVKGEPDYTTIEEGKDPGITPELETFINKCFPDPLFTKEQLDAYYPHLSTTMGPNGPATLSATDDLKALDDDLKSDLYYLSNDTDDWLGKYFRIENPVSLNKCKDPSNLITRRLQVIDDKEGKTRIVAMFDYWSQGVLKPLHKALNQVLRMIPSDCTFNQQNFKSILTDPRVSSQTIYSIDLKAATDKMPAFLQSFILGKLIGDEEYGETWLRVMTDREFMCPDGKPRAYAQGQPMGAYSSWPMMAITHHVIIWYAANRVKTDPIYFVLGDDALIVGDELYASYIEVLTELNMELSESKTFKSKDLFEFAKRLFYKGEEISPIPIEAVLSSKGDAPLLVMAIDNMLMKSILTLESICEARIIGFLSALLNTFGADLGKCRGAAKRMQRAVLTMDVMRWLQQEDCTHAPLGVNMFRLSCNRSPQRLREKLSYCYSQSMADLAGELYSQSISSYQLIEQHLYQVDALFQTPVENSADGPQPIMVPIWQVVAKKTQLLAEIANAQYDTSKTIPELNEQWGGYLDELSYVLPSWDTFDNRKGSAKRARTKYDLFMKLTKFIDKWYDGRI